MEKEISARAIIIENDEVYLMYRKKKKKLGIIKEYYITPGGSVEPGETLEEAVVREIKEEFQVDIEIIKYIGKKEGKKKIANFFECKIINGTPSLGGEEIIQNNENNQFEIRKEKISNLNNLKVKGKKFIYEVYNAE